MQLNERALRRCEQFLVRADEYRVGVARDESGARIVDCGIHHLGSLEAGRGLAEICLADLGRVSLAPRNDGWGTGLSVTVTTDQPVAACMASQYAGWELSGEKFFAMGSGPMRAARGREPLFDDIGGRETAAQAIGVLETRKLPTPEICRRVADECRVEAERVTLLVAPTASLAGTLQVVARSVETALHKLHELGFDLARVLSAWGQAPLPPLAADDLAAIGRTNDAVLYGGEVTLWVAGDEASLAAIGPQVPSSASHDYGQPFAEIFARYGHDFYQIDPLLFSPAVVTLISRETGRCLRFGQLAPDILRRSWGV